MKIRRFAFLVGTLATMVIIGACNRPQLMTDETVNNSDRNLLETPTPEPLPPIDEDSYPNDYSVFFSEELQRAGVERVGQPIEGFNAFIYLEAFPGFEESDFDGVKTLEGIYMIED